MDKLSLTHTHTHLMPPASLHGSLKWDAKAMQCQPDDMHPENEGDPAALPPSSLFSSRQLPLAAKVISSKQTSRDDSAKLGALGGTKVGIIGQ